MAGSIRAGSSGAPESSPKRSISARNIAPPAAAQWPANSGSCQSGAHSSTSCPSAASSPAAWWAAATHSGSTSSPPGAVVHSRIRSGCGGCSDGVRERGPRQRRAERCRGPVAGQQVERERGVVHRAGEHAVDAEGLEGGQLGPERDAEAGRLEPDDAAAGGRDPDRAAGVVAVRERDQAGRDRGGAAARGAAGDQARVVRVARRAVALGLGDGPHRPTRACSSCRRRSLPRPAAAPPGPSPRPAPSRRASGCRWSSAAPP